MTLFTGAEAVVRFQPRRETKRRHRISTSHLTFGGRIKTVKKVYVLLNLAGVSVGQIRRNAGRRKRWPP